MQSLVFDSLLLAQFYRIAMMMEQADKSFTKAQDDGQKSSEDIISRQLTYSRKEFRIRICGGGSNGKQSIPCDTALLGFRLSQQDLKVIVDIVNPGQRHLWGPQQTIDWLLASDFHIIRTHLHQGKLISYRSAKSIIFFGYNCPLCFCFSGHYNESPDGSDWNLTDVVQQIQRLKNHRGFPTAQFLQCPVFLQDKFDYLRCVPEISLPTLKVTRYELYV